MKLPIPTNILSQTPRAYLVGGSVRDMICGRRPLDYDIVVAKDPQGYAETLAARLNGCVVTIGKPGFPLYRIVKAPIAVDVTPLKGATLAADLSDRDFTINALAYDLNSEKIIDTTGGVADVEQGLVRMVSARAFKNDPVRMVRAHRMAIQLDFDMDPATSRAISAHAHTIQTSPGERIWAELALILSQPNSVETLRQMAQDELLFAIFPELGPLKGCRQSEPHHLDVLDHTLLAYQSLEGALTRPVKWLTGQAAALTQTFSPERQTLLKLALLLHDIGKPAKRSIDASGKIHFYGHAASGIHLARAIFKRLRMPKQEANWVDWIIANHSRPHDLYKLDKDNRLTPKAIGKFLRLCAKHAPHLILHAMADNLGKDLSINNQIKERLSFFNHLLEAYFKTAATGNTAPLIGGRDLMAAFDLSPSPLLGALLKGIEEARLAGIFTSREAALEWAEAFLREKGILSR